MVKPLVLFCTFILLFVFIDVVRVQADFPPSYVNVRSVAEETGFSVSGTRRSLFLRCDEGTVMHFIVGRGYAVLFCPDITRQIIYFTDAIAPIIHNDEMYLNTNALMQMLGLVYITPRFHPINNAAEARYLHN